MIADSQKKTNFSGSSAPLRSPDQLLSHWVRPTCYSEYLDYDREGELRLENVRIRDLAARYQTPLYAYSFGTVLKNLQRFRQAAESAGFRRFLICYAMKANGNLALIRLLGQLGCGTDIVSGGELHQSLQAGIPPQKIIFSGVGKTLSEIRDAVKQKILLLNVESREEMVQIAELANENRIRIPISIRLNPNVQAATHKNIQTGGQLSKFGVSVGETEALIQEYSKHPFLKIMGLGFHLGSQIRDYSCFAQAIAMIAPLLKRQKDLLDSMRYFHLGGGLAIRYTPEDDWAENVSDYIKNFRELQTLLPAQVTFIFEPGRFLIGNAGFLLGRVIRYKQIPGRTVVVTDAAMDNLIRPALYDGYHHIYPATLPISSHSSASSAAPASSQYDVVGPICETTDYLARDRCLQLRQNPPEDLLLFASSGAYTSVLASNYNGRLRAAEVMVWRGEHSETRSREDLEDLWRRDLFLQSDLEQKILLANRASV